MKLNCHCGAVEAEINVPINELAKIVKCNCSICKRKSATMGMVKNEDFKITKGEDKLKLYQYHTKVAKHYFCSECGIYTHHHPRSNPAMTGFNLGCVDEVDVADLKDITLIDGQNHPMDQKKIISSMKVIEECFNKVKKDCFKFIKSQETSTEKFGNKDGMLKSFLIPMCFWIAKKANNKKPYFVGLAGGQGTGKTTISSIIKIILEKYFKLKVFKISIDDFYKTRKERLNLSKKVHPMLATRGVPGTHDVQMMLNFFKKAKSKNFKKIDLPNFNKAVDDRFSKKNWYKIKEKPDVIIFEGWCVGAKAEENKTLKKSINSLEKANDRKFVWRRYVNQQLKTKYKELYSQLNCLIYLKAKNFSLLQKWRLKQEHKLWLNTKKSSSHKIMSKGDVINFMQTYQRITENMFKKMPKYASIILNLNSNHQIKSAVYKTK